MNTDKTYHQLVQKMHEVSELSPQTLGPFTPVYRAVIPFFKRAPWRPLMVGSFALTVVVYFLLGTSAVIVVSILQHGF
ncbi:MAG: hypothetical protein NUV98_03595 [Candidatus Roizmanbacteria bacterium]|nr:hypothetical protein [Candidatus Roizmanbacteria bacterium]